MISVFVVLMFLLVCSGLCVSQVSKKGKGKAIVMAVTVPLFFCQTLMANMQNGDFESWTGGLPTAWAAVDYFQPTSNTASDEDEDATDSTETVLTLITDNYGRETSWDIKDSNSQVLYSGSGYESNTTYTETFNLEDGEYTFTIYDSYGDGICCSYGEGAYAISAGGIELASGGQFDDSETVTFSIGGSSGGTGSLSEYYQSAEGLSGYNLKTALHNIIKNHNSRSYGDLWDLYASSEIDSYYENDGTILDIYSENPTGSDPYNYTIVSDQCGTYSSEGDCYNREHTFPKSWFGGEVYPMYTDAHHIYASDGYVNARRSNYPYGEVGSATYMSENGCLLGSAASGLGYSGTVFEPIDEFKGDLARAYFYMATRYQDVIASWESNSANSDAVLNGTSNQVFEDWFLDLLLQWHQQDPVSQKEIDRNDAVFDFQENRNPFVDHPEFVNTIWGN